MEQPKFDVEQRFLLAVVSLCVLILLLAPTIAISISPESWSYRIARITAYPRLVAFGFLGSVCLMTPLAFCIHNLTFMRSACFGGCTGAFASFGMSYISRDVDLGFQVWKFQNAYSFYYTIVGAACLVFAAAIAVLLNMDMLKLQKEHNHE